MNNIELLKPSYSEIRNDKYLLIWADVPFWLICDEDVYRLFSFSNPEYTIDSFYFSYMRKYPDSSVTKSEFSKILYHLDNKGLMKGLNQDETKNDMIENVTINITNKCNLNCITCYNQPMEHGTDNIKSKDIEFLLSSLKSIIKKDSTFAVLGGEPLLTFEETLDSCIVAKKHGLKPIISTNGTLITNEIAKKLKKNKIELQISLDGATEPTNDYIRGSGTFSKVENNVKICKEHKVYTILCMVVCDKNIEELEQFIELGYKWGVNEVRFIPLKRIGHGKSNEINPPDLIELINHIKVLLLKNKKYRKLLLRDIFTIMAYQTTICDRREFCGAGLKTIFLDADGSLYPCPNFCYDEFKFANIKDKNLNLLDAWLQSPKIKRVRECYSTKSTPPCSDCPVKYWCAGECRGESYSIFGELGKLSPNCKANREAIIEMMWILGDYPELKPLRAKEEHF